VQNGIFVNDADEVTIDASTSTFDGFFGLPISSR
jgi:hypothetical protein